MAANMVVARNNLANIYLSRGMYDKAISEYRTIITSIQDSPVVRYNLGLAYFQKGMTDDAYREWKEALRIDPGFQPALKALESINGKEK